MARLLRDVIRWREGDSVQELEMDAALEVVYRGEGMCFFCMSFVMRCRMLVTDSLVSVQRLAIRMLIADAVRINAKGIRGDGPAAAERPVGMQACCTVHRGYMNFSTC
jgi:hypothetical protein